MTKGHPAVELPGEDLPAQYPPDERSNGTQPFTNVEQRTGVKAKALTDPQRFGRSKHLHPTQKVGKRGRRLARTRHPPEI